MYLVQTSPHRHGEVVLHKTWRARAPGWVRMSRHCGGRRNKIQGMYRVSVIHDKVDLVCFKLAGRSLYDDQLLRCEHASAGLVNPSSASENYISISVLSWNQVKWRETLQNVDQVHERKLKILMRGLCLQKPMVLV